VIIESNVVERLVAVRAAFLCTAPATRKIVYGNYLW